MKEAKHPASVGIRNDFNESERSILTDKPQFGGDILAGARISATAATPATTPGGVSASAVVDATKMALAALADGRIDIARDVLRALLDHISTAPSGRGLS